MFSDDVAGSGEHALFPVGTLWKSIINRKERLSSFHVHGQQRRLEKHDRRNEDAPTSLHPTPGPMEKHDDAVVDQAAFACGYAGRALQLACPAGPTTYIFPASAGSCRDRRFLAVSVSMPSVCMCVYFRRVSKA